MSTQNGPSDPGSRMLQAWDKALGRFQTDTTTNLTSSPAPYESVVDNDMLFSTLLAHSADGNFYQEWSARLKESLGSIVRDVLCLSEIARSDTAPVSGFVSCYRAISCHAEIHIDS